jgi:hypothetical protein
LCEHNQSFEIKGNRLHEGVELVFGESLVSRSFTVVGENPFVWRPQAAIPFVEIEVFTLHVIFLDGAEVEIICFSNALNILVAVAFVLAKFLFLFERVANYSLRYVICQHKLLLVLE